VPLPWLDLVREGNLIALKEMVNEDAGILKQVDEMGYNLLHIASKYNQKQIVSYLATELKMEINVLSTIKYTPLILAAMEGCEETVQLLLDLGANAQIVDAESNTALEYALRNNHTGVVSILIEYTTSNSDKGSDKEEESMAIQSLFDSDPEWVVGEHKESPKIIFTPATMAPVTTTTQTNITTPTTITTPPPLTSEERQLFLARITELETEVDEKNRQLQQLEDSSLCVICVEHQINTVLLDCGHLCLCLQCSTKPGLLTCPLCKKTIIKILQTFKP